MPLNIRKIVRMIDQRVRELKLRRKLLERQMFHSEMTRAKVKRIA